MKFQTKQKRKTYSDSLKINYLHGAIKISLTKKNIIKFPIAPARGNLSRSNVAMKSDEKSRCLRRGWEKGRGESK